MFCISTGDPFLHGYRHTRSLYQVLYIWMMCSGLENNCGGERLFNLIERATVQATDSAFVHVCLCIWG